MGKTWLVAILVLVVACDKGSSGTSDCALAAKGLIKSLSSAANADMKGTLIEAALTKRCTADKWSLDAQACVAKATTAESQSECWYKHLTQAQKDSLDTALEPLHRTSFSQAMIKMAEFKNSMCACKDAKCAERVSDDMMKWSQEMSKDMKEPPKMSEADMKAATEIGQQMGECMQKAMGVSLDSDTLSVTGIEPEQGDVEGGTYVRIRGSRFISDGARNAKVYFGSRQGTVIRFASDTELIVEAPGGKPGDVVDVLLIFEPGGELKLPKAFTYVEKR